MWNHVHSFLHYFLVLVLILFSVLVFFFQAEDGIRDAQESRGLGDVYKSQMDPHSASAQFFINVGDNAFLNHTGKDSQGWGYAVFGKVVEGMDVVNTIKKVATTSKSGHQDVPADPVVIDSATMIED